MSEYRKLYVLKAFVKMDANKHGAITFGDVRKFYNVHKHPKVRSGECTEDEIVKMFLDSFDVTVVKGELTFREFEEYYEGLSIGVESDEDFCNILRNAWNV
jgi:Ca2+-binding EF-hand superfamily protein